jgi:hypothetical protein
MSAEARAPAPYFFVYTSGFTENRRALLAPMLYIVLMTEFAG